MRILKHKKTVFSIGAIAFVAVVSGVFIQGASSLSLFSKPVAEVKLSDFTPGTEVDYRILSGGEVVAQNTDVIKKDGVLSLPLNRDMLKDKAQKIVQYELSMHGPEGISSDAASAEMLRVLLNLDKSTGDVSVSASGLDEYSNVVLQNDDKEEQLSADWAGMFSADVQKNKDRPSYENEAALKMAFQNSGMSGDLKSLNPGEIEVFFGIFGDSSGSNVNAVQSRWSSALIRMTEELSAVMVLQTEIIGMFFDASIQMETQRKHQELMARAHKDYHPSDQMCRIGTFMRSVAHTESKAQVEKTALNKILIEEYNGVENTASGGGIQVYENAKVSLYVDKYCDTKDNGSANTAFCNIVTGATTAADMDRLNKDVDYTRVLASKLTLDVNFTDATPTADEEDLIALAKNLYFPSSFGIPDIEQIQKDPRAEYESRSYAAKMGVAHNSFINIIGMKARAPEGQPTSATTTTPTPIAYGQVPPVTTRPAPATLTEDSGWAYMKAMMREFGLADLDIDKVLGERPSYYAQMEVLTKKIYQSPNFYTNLYDKPVNVERIGASLDAIALMSQRDRFESLLRREMLTAVLVEEELKSHVEEVNANIYEAMQGSQISD